MRADLAAAAAFVHILGCPPHDLFVLGFLYSVLSPGARNIVLGSYDRLNRNVGVLFAWLGLWFLAALLSVFLARKQVEADLAAKRSREDQGNGAEIHSFP